MDSDRGTGQGQDIPTVCVLSCPVFPLRQPGQCPVMSCPVPFVPCPVMSNLHTSGGQDSRSIVGYFQAVRSPGGPARQLPVEDKPMRDHQADFPYVYRWNRQGRKGQACRGLTRGTQNSRLLEFKDGYRMVTSGNALKRRRTKQIGIANPEPGIRSSIPSTLQPCSEPAKDLAPGSNAVTCSARRNDSVVGVACFPDPRARSPRRHSSPTRRMVYSAPLAGLRDSRPATLGPVLCVAPRITGQTPSQRTNAKCLPLG
jgi:hypothetical protein